jgi:glycosyltransferase involved in cell wall biosynthesis
VRVGISMLTLVPGGMGGSETYARSLCRALSGQHEIEATAFVAASGSDAGEGLETRVVSEYPSGTSAVAKVGGMAVGIARRGSIARHFRGIDVVHYPFTVPVPRLPLPSVVTVHDLQHLDLPNLFSRQRRLYRRVAYDRAARRADTVVVPSAFVRSRAEDLLGLDPSRVNVVPHGVDHAVFSPSGAPREPFVLYPARVWPHKNHARLLAAFALLRRSHPELTLVFTGAGTEALAGQPWVSARGVVSQLELVRLYGRASLVVFPSLYEGFGAPPLEAMACGTPVAAANSGSIPEVCGDAAVLFDPNHAEAIAAGMSEALDRAHELSRSGVARAAHFTWQASAAGHEQAYRRAAELRSV